MAQFDVYRTAKGSDAPFLVDLQNDLLDASRTRIVAPLRRSKESAPLIKGLHVKLGFRNADHVLSPEEMAAVPLTILGDYAGTIAAHRAEIVAALDLLFTGI